MSKAGYIGVSDKAHKIKKMYVGVNGVARQVKKAYVGDVNGIARQWFASRYFEYTGDYTEREITIDGKAYILYTLTSSGTLNCSEAQYWMCGGGAGGTKRDKLLLWRRWRWWPFGIWRSGGRTVFSSDRRWWTGRRKRGRHNIGRKSLCKRSRSIEFGPRRRRLWRFRWWRW